MLRPRAEGGVMAVAGKAIATAVLLASSVALSAQTVNKPGETIKRTVTIQQIDSTNRLLTYKSEDGSEVTIWAPPAMARFNELKVGDRVSLTYYDSTVFQIRKPGAPAQKPTDDTKVTATTGALPGGTVARQATTSVTVKS